MPMLEKTLSSFRITQKTFNKYLNMRNKGTISYICQALKAECDMVDKEYGEEYPVVTKLVIEKLALCIRMLHNKMLGTNAFVEEI